MLKIHFVIYGFQGIKLDFTNIFLFLSSNMKTTQVLKTISLKQMYVFPFEMLLIFSDPL